MAGWATFTEALEPTRDALSANSSGSLWGARFFVAGDPPELVRWGGFKGPLEDGAVELGYEIAEGRRGRGLATAATRAMLAEAFADQRMTAVIAHTLAERNASTASSAFTATECGTRASSTPLVPLSERLQAPE